MKLGFICKAFVLGSLGVIALSNRAQALNFNFYVPNTVTSDSTPIEGIIKDINTPSTTVEVTRSPNSLYNGTYSFVSGSFTLDANNIITAANSVIYRSVLVATQDMHFNFRGYNGWFNAQNGQEYGNNGNFQGVTYTAAATAVPFDFSPAEGAALGVPLFIGLRLLGKKRLAQKFTVSKATTVKL